MLGTIITALCLLVMPHKDRMNAPHSQAIGDLLQKMYSRRLSPETSLPVYSQGCEAYT